MITLVLVGALAAHPQETEPLILRTALHVHTTFSDGSHTVEEIARRAREEGIDAVLLADHFSTYVEYGPPLFPALAVSVRFPSLGARDLKRYLETCRRVEAKSGVLILPGVEITPFYYWQGSLLTGDLTLHNAHRHLVAFFPDNPELVPLSRALMRMSAPGVVEYRASSVLLFLPLLPAIWAINRLRRGRRQRQSLLPILGWCVVAIVSIAALARSWPYRVPRHSAYAGDLGAAPYQDALDSSHSSGTLTFWAHPETSTEFEHSFLPLTYRSDKYSALVAATRGATGFASLYEGHRRTAKPAGPWDEASNEFVSGDRVKPLWTVGELDLHREGEAGGKFLGEVETIVFARDRSRQAVLDALARGSAYAVRQPEDTRLSLEHFRAICLGNEVQMGEQTSVAGPCRIEARVRADGEALDDVSVSVIRNGEVLVSRDVDINEHGVEFEWGPDATEQPRFYRLVARRGNRVALYTNPLFVGVREASP